MAAGVTDRVWSLEDLIEIKKRTRTMGQVFECEQCDKVIDPNHPDTHWVEVDLEAKPNILAQQKGRVHFECLEAYRKKHPR
jgi:valyl-tRNA synthetase